MSDDRNVITFSYPTTGPSGAEEPGATYQFISAGYTPAAQGRSSNSDVVHNQNGVFKYIYDNGPNVRKWNPFELVMADRFASLIGADATTQWQNFDDLWQHTGEFGMDAPDGLFDTHFSGEDMERKFETFPDAVGDKIEYRVTVQLEEA